jgi:hypothetical protein
MALRGGDNYLDIGEIWAANPTAPDPKINISPSSNRELELYRYGGRVMPRRTNLKKDDTVNKHRIGGLSAVIALPRKLLAGLLRLRQARRSTAKRNHRL